MSLSIENSIVDYVKLETNYALIISGEYGVGKTHFFKNQLSNRLEKLEYHHDSSKKFIPIHVSLFGVSSIEEIYSKIFVEIFPFLKTKELKFTAAISKIIIKAKLSLSGLGNLDDFSSEITELKDNYIDFQRIILCFDDIDRKSDTLKIGLLMGFINDLVENQSAKVLLIAKEETLNEEGNYLREIQEKVIGSRILFKPDSIVVLRAIINGLKESYPTYFDFLIIQESELLGCLSQNGNNFRSLNYFIRRFHEIHSQCIKNKSEEGLNANFDKKLLAIFKFALAFSFEYKKGISKDELELFSDIKTHSHFSLDMLRRRISDKDLEGNLNFTDKFRGKYYPKERNIDFYPSILQYLSEMESFNIKKLLEQLSERDKLIKSFPKQKILLDKLQYWDFLKLNTREYRKSSNELKKLAITGNLILYDYPTALMYLLRFDNHLNYKVEDLIEGFKKGILKSSKRSGYLRNLSFRVEVNNNTSYGQEITQIQNFCKTANNTGKNLSETQYVEEIFNSMSEDIIKTLDMLEDYEVKEIREYKYKPFFHLIGLNKFYSLFKKITPFEISQLAFFIRDRYHNNSQLLEKEYEFLQALLTKIDSDKNRKIKNQRNIAVEVFTRKVSVILDEHRKRDI